MAYCKTNLVPYFDVISNFPIADIDYSEMGTSEVIENRIFRSPVFWLACAGYSTRNKVTILDIEDVAYVKYIGEWLYQNLLSEDVFDAIETYKDTDKKMTFVEYIRESSFGCGKKFHSKEEFLEDEYKNAYFMEIILTTDELKAYHEAIGDDWEESPSAELDIMSITDFAKKLGKETDDITVLMYASYVNNWVEEHLTVQQIKNTQKAWKAYNEKNPDAQVDFYDFLMENGFYGELFASYDEYIDNEFAEAKEAEAF